MSPIFVVSTWIVRVDVGLADLPSCFSTIEVIAVPLIVLIVLIVLPVLMAKPNDPVTQ